MVGKGIYPMRLRLLLTSVTLMAILICVAAACADSPEDQTAGGNGAKNAAVQSPSGKLPCTDEGDPDPI